MARILSQSGNSLADIYDVRGSIAGIDNLETKDLPITHEMGGTVFSERFSTQTLSEFVDDFAQNTGFNRTMTLPTNTPYLRIMSAAVFVDVTARITLASLSLIDEAGVEIPFWSWDSADDNETSVRHTVDGGAAATTIFLRPTQPYFGSIPGLIALAGQPLTTPTISFRGLSSGFGAGTVQITALLHVGFPRQTGVSARGLPVPSW